MRHFKQAARLYLFHKEPHCTDACIQRLTLHPFILCSSQWAGGNGGEKGDKTKAHAKGESKIAPKVWTHTCSFGTWKGQVVGQDKQTLWQWVIWWNGVCVYAWAWCWYFSGSLRRHWCPCCPCPFNMLDAKLLDPIGRCWACSHPCQIKE